MHRNFTFLSREAAEGMKAAPGHRQLMSWPRWPGSAVQSKPWDTRTKLARLLLALLTLGVLDGFAPSLPDPGPAGQVVWLALVSTPMAALAVFVLADGVRRPALLTTATAGGTSAVALMFLGFPDTPPTLGKLIFAAGLGLITARVVKTPLELIVIAAAISVSDAISVFHGTTKLIAENHEQTLDALTLHFHLVGSSAVAQLGMTDIFFFASFLAVAESLRLRTRATWLTMTLSLGVTGMIADTTDRLIPALPLLAIAAIIVNADRLAVRRAGDWEGQHPSESPR